MLILRLNEFKLDVLPVNDREAEKKLEQQIDLSKFAFWAFSNIAASIPTVS